MFERYTETARRVVFFARYEASESHSPTIEPEHLLLAILREDERLIAGLLPPLKTAELKAEVKALGGAPAAGDQAGAVDLPVSPAGKRVLSYAAQQADSMGDRAIFPKHLLLGILEEKESPAAQILSRFGIAPELIAGTAGVRPPVTREALSEVVATLPESALEQARTMLTRMQRMHAGPPARMSEIQREMQERFRKSVPPGGGGMIGGGGGSWRTDEQGEVRDGTYGWSRMENGEQVRETHHFFKGHEIITTERTSLDQEKQILRWSVEVKGPDRELQSFGVEFPVIPRP